MGRVGFGWGACMTAAEVAARATAGSSASSTVVTGVATCFIALEADTGARVADAAASKLITSRCEEAVLVCELIAA